MAVKSKTQKSNSFIMLGGKKGVPKKQQQQQEPEEEDSDMLDSEAEEDDDEMELEDDESIAPEDDDSDVDEGEESDEAPAQVPAKGNKQQGKANNTPTKANKAGKVAPAKASPKVGGSPNDTQSKQSISDRLARTVCVKHLKPTSTDEQVVEFFADVGKCKLARRVRSKALAIVMFDNAGQVEKALRKSGEALNGHPVVVERSKFGSASLEAYKAKKKLRTKERREARRLKAKQQPAGVKGGAGQQKQKQQSKPAAATAASPVKKSPAKNQKQRQQKGKAGGAKPNANKQQAPKGKKEKK
ncbi:AGAP009336-PA [Anopheles gambiae str. PEST]|uniref:AGAP009336-PA n=1 Tax=Anopheles gambiae TaxID=7165 RepID=Q7QGF3_ANOGA|nr:AGAP009336-PA [Anopheles gambiae str. PEST]